MPSPGEAMMTAFMAGEPARPRNSHNDMDSKTRTQAANRKFRKALKRRMLRSEMKFLSRTAVAAIIASTTLSGCTTANLGETMSNGYVVAETSLALIPVGSSREHDNRRASCGGRGGR